MDISIIIPVYNVEHYIEDCLHSVMNQTMNEGLECILVDDCGLDKSMEIAESFVGGYKGNIIFRIVRHDHNRGLSCARNTGIRNATGKYIYFLDSDDMLTPNCIEVMLKCIKTHPESEMVQAGCIYTNHQNPFPALEGNNRLPDFVSDRNEIMELLYKQYELPMISVNRLISKRFIEEHNLYFAEGMLHEDIPYVFRLGNTLSCFSICKHDTYIYVNHDNSITTDNSHQRHISAWISALNYCISMINYRQNPGRQVDYILSHYLDKVQMYITNGGLNAFEPILSNLCFKAQGKKRLILLLYKLCPARLRLQPFIHVRIVNHVNMIHWEGFH